MPVGADGLEHCFGGVVQPLGFLFVDVAEDGFAGGGSAEVDVGGFPSHGVEEAEFVIGGAQGGEQDAGAVGARRRTIQRPRNWTKGSGQRTARLMMVW